MARRTKEEKFNIEVEAALESALGFNFDDADSSARKDVSSSKDLPGKATKSPTHRVIDGGLAQKKTQDDTSDAVFAFKDFGSENNDGSFSDDIFDLEDLEQQIASSARELNKDIQKDTSKSSGSKSPAEYKSDNRSDTHNTPYPADALMGNDKKENDEDYIFVDEKLSSEFSDSVNQDLNNNYKESFELTDFEQESFEGGKSADKYSIQSDEDWEYSDNSGSNLGEASQSSGEPPAPPKKKGLRKIFARNPLYWTTAAISALWAAGGIGIAYKLSLENSSSLSSFITSAQGLLVTAGTIVPVLMFWGFAQLSHRASELQKIVQTMTGAAMRLLEPDSSSKKSVSSLGHTIRREVAAMEGGIDRTMSRASELEALLQNEVNNLERSYGENEVRIRSLIAELANEREAVATHADNVKSKITGAKDQLTQEFSSIADHINATAESFTITLSETLNSRWGDLVNEFNSANEDVAQQLSQKFVDTVQSFDSSRGQFFKELDSRFSQIDEHTDAASKAVAERLSAKMDDFVEIVRGRTEEVENRFDALSGRLAGSGNKVIDSVNNSVSEIEQRTQDIEARLQAATDKVLENFDDKFQDLDNTLTDRSNRSIGDFNDQIERLGDRAHDLSSVFDDASQAAVATLDKHLEDARGRARVISEQINQDGSQAADSVIKKLQEVEKYSSDVDARLTSSSQAVMEAFEGKFNALDNLFTDRSNRSVSLFAEQVDKLGQKSESLSSNFESATKVAVEHFEERLNEVDGFLSHKSTSLIHTFIEKTESLEESTEKLNTALELHVGRVNEAFNSRASDITESLTNGRNDILSVVDETKVRLSQEMENVGQTVGKFVDESAGSFIHQFSEGREKLSQTLQDETNRIMGTVSEQISQLSNYVSDIENKLLDRVTDIDSKTRGHVEQLNARTSEFEKTITSTFDVTREMIETQAHTMDVRASSFRDSLQANSSELNSALGQQAAVLEERIATIREIIANSDSAFAETMRQHVETFGQSVENSDAELKTIFVDQLQKLEGQTSRLKEVFNNNNSSLEESFNGKISNLQGLFDNNRGSIEALLDNHGNIISDRATQLQNNLSSTLSAVDANLSKQGELLDKRAYNLRDAVDHNSVVLADTFQQQTALIDERSKAMQQTLEAGISNVSTTLDAKAVKFTEALNGQVSDVTTAFEDGAYKSESVISSAADRLLTSVYDAANNLDQKLDNRTKSLNSSLTEAAQDMDQRFAERGTALTEILGNTSSRLNAGIADIESRVTSFGNSLGEEAKKANALMLEAGEKVSGTVLESAEKADKAFANRSSELLNNIELVEGRLSSGLQAIQEHMLGTTSEVEERLSDKSLSFKQDLQKMGIDINSDIDAIRERIIELSQNTTEDLSEKTGNLYALTEQLRNAATRTSDSLASLTGTFNKQLQEVTQAAEERLRQENENFISNFSGHTENAVSAVQAAKTELENQVNRLLEKMENSNSSIRQTVGNLNENVDDVDKKLGSLTSEFKQNINQLSEDFGASSSALNEDLQRFNGHSRDVLGNLTAFSDQFNSHVDLLKEATNILENSNSAFTEKLENGQESLNKLATGLVSKSDEISGVMHNCEEVITSVIKNVENKTWSSTSELRTALSDLINEASGRFEGATANIRRSADDIREELTRTKADLNNGISSLPDQTKEYTEAMRQAVQDQIKALKDLSAIVEESGALLDAQKQHVSEAQDTLKSSQVAVNNKSEYQDDSSKNGYANAVSNQQEEKISRPYQNQSVQQDSKSFSNNTGRTKLSASADRNHEVKSNGWVSDLLARASTDEPIEQQNSVNTAYQESSHEQAGNMLNSISGDIVQAIDNDGISKLWHHYRRGQQNVSPNLLYTPEGYRVFENIKQKYAFDGQFRKVVGQYITDFEHLLADVTRNGGDNHTVRNYLVSDTGKVYTMLAHISGRIQ